MRQLYFLLILLVLAGQTGISQSFQLISITIPGVNNGGSCWGDYDNDDDLDLLICGMNELGEGATFLCRNDDGIFTVVGTPFTGIEMKNLNINILGC